MNTPVDYLCRLDDRIGSLYAARILEEFVESIIKEFTFAMQEAYQAGQADMKARVLHKLQLYGTLTTECIVENLETQELEVKE